MEEHRNKDTALSILEAILNNPSLTEKQRARLLEKIRAELHQTAGVLPLSIFSNDVLGALEAIVKFLRENRRMPFTEMSSLLGRPPKALAVTYHYARKKMPSSFVLKESPFAIPSTVLRNDQFTVLENIVAYLKETYSLTNHQIAVLLKRDDRTIWSVLDRAKKKRSAP